MARINSRKELVVGVTRVGLITSCAKLKYAQTLTNPVASVDAGLEKGQERDQSIVGKLKSPKRLYLKVS